MDEHFAALGSVHGGEKVHFVSGDTKITRSGFARRFEEHRRRLRAVARRVFGPQLGALRDDALAFFPDADCEVVFTMRCGRRSSCRRR